ncbi:MAG: DUF2752 domain-containing protein [Lachnospiraceae bacterium]|nr:DUF2752 domain-containing protein [Lachnospiraceae bacterium]
MKRSFKVIILEGFQQFIKDIKQTKWAIIAIIAYFAFVRKFIFSMCPLVMITGYPCPSCGLTRAGIRLLHLDFGGAWRMHPFIYGVVILVAVFCWNRYICLRQRQPKNMKLLAGTMIVFLVVFYIYRMVRYFPTQPPMNYYSNNLFLRYWHALMHLLNK